MALSAVLGLVVFAIYGRTIGYDFVLYDDMVYIVDNERLKDGLSFGNIFWSFTTSHFANWHPVTWLSYLLDVEFFGLEAPGFHRTNVAIHAANSVLLLWWLSDATKRLWPSAFVALLFAVHPLHVESVAWISERKDVLSTFFMFLTLIAYSRYVRSPSSRVYVAVELLFVCALLSKQMLVTLPLVLLLLDIWPYDRVSQEWPIRRLFTEKIPLFVLAGLAGAMTLIAQGRGGFIVSTDDWPLIRRPLTAMASYGIYAVQTVFPAQLSVFYPRHWGMGFWLEALAGASLVLVLTYVSLRTFKQHPYFLVGWFWFLVTLIPVIGIVQVGRVAHADRYTYIPQIGLLIMGVWFTAHVASLHRRLKFLGVGLCLAVSILFSVAAHRQVGAWENSETLFRNAIARSDDSAWIHWALGRALMESENDDEAHAHFDRALDLEPDHSGSLFAKAERFKQRGDLDEAETYLLRIIANVPEEVPTNRLLGEIYLEKEQYDEAIVRFEHILNQVENDIEGRVALGIALTRSGRPEDGIAQFRQAIGHDSSHAPAHYNYGLALTRAGETATAIEAFERTIELQSVHVGAHEQLIPLLEAAGRQDEAIRYGTVLDHLRSATIDD